MRKLHFTLAVAIFTAGLSSKTISQSAYSYDPIRFGIPETIGGYHVLAVLTEENSACMRAGGKRLILQSPQPTIEDGPRDFPKKSIEQELQALNLAEYPQWGLEIVGPGVTREQLFRQYEQLYRFFKAHDCPTLGLPTSDRCPFLAEGEVRCERSAQGYAIVQNLIAPPDVNNNGQSVILIAPTVGNNNTARWGVCAPPLTIPGCIPVGWTGGYSAFLNNGMTDTGYFLQVGLYFTNRADRGGNIPEIPQGCVTLNDPGNPFSPEGIGMVVWAGAQTGEGSTEAELGAHPLCVPYISGHHYYTTIAYTSGIWWTCAADMQDTTTYRCHPHEGATGTRLINSVAGTNVFAENWNKDAGWTSGFPYQWVAYGANIYKEGIGYPWKSETTWTQHSCNNAYPPESAIEGGLVPGSPVNDGYAFFNTYYLPLYCDR